MRYISDDNKVFNTEQECREHEQEVERLENEERIVIGGSHIIKIEIMFQVIGSITINVASSGQRT